MMQVEELVGRKITIRDERTGYLYAAPITRATRTYGKVRVELDNSQRMFQPTAEELKGVK